MKLADNIFKDITDISPQYGDAKSILDRCAGWKVLAPSSISHYWIGKKALNIICSALISSFQKSWPQCEIFSLWKVNELLGNISAVWLFPRKHIWTQMLTHILHIPFQKTIADAKYFSIQVNGTFYFTISRWQEF